MIPLVSIIVPYYNVSENIETSINSLTSQSYSNIEILFVDDGSTHECMENACQYLKHDERIKIVQHKKNRGLSSSRNTGLKHSKGKYVLFWDAGDCLDSNTIKVFVDLAIKNSSEIVRGVLARTNVDKRWITKRGRRLLKNIPQTTFEKSPELAMDFTSCGVLFSRTFLKKNDLAFVPNLYMQDILFTSRALVCAKNICMSDQITGDYFQSPKSSSRIRSSERFESLFALYEKLEQFFDHKEVDSRQREILLAGFINAGVNTFLLWKLEEHKNDIDDLERLSVLLSNIGERAINQYCMDMFDETSYLRLHATRLKNYGLAASAANIMSISFDSLNNLFGEGKQKEITTATEFLNQLRIQRNSSVTNSKMLIRPDASSKSSTFVFAKNVLTQVKAKLRF